jgi:hypothetical protein
MKIILEGNDDSGWQATIEAGWHGNLFGGTLADMCEELPEVIKIMQNELRTKFEPNFGTAVFKLRASDDADKN